MSSKQKSSPTLPPYEMIVTRRKSAQLKRQLREKDRSMSHITQLLIRTPASLSPKQCLQQKNATTPPKTSTVTQKSNVSSKSLINKPMSLKNIPLPRKQKMERGKLPKKLQSKLYYEEIKEYYPNKMKRELKNNKILLKPKSNLKIIGGTNKRKLATPKKGIKSYNANTLECEFNDIAPTTELSMAEVIKLTEEVHGLDDDDLMEILTCPSPVWWEDPPDTRYDEDPILKATKTQDNPIQTDNPTVNSSSDSIIAKPNTDEPLNLNNPTIPSDKNFIMKRNKLENVLGNIKNKIGDNVDANTETNTKQVRTPTNNRRKISESSDCISDGSILDDELLTGLENMDIPIEDKDNKEDDAKVAEITDGNAIESENTIEDNKEIPTNMPELTKNPNLKQYSRIPSKSSDYEHDNVDSISDTNIKYLEDDSEDVKTSDSGKDDQRLLSDSKHCDAQKNDINRRDNGKLNAYYKKCKNANSPKHRSKSEISPLIYPHMDTTESKN